jgi:hypothetical protein
VEATSVAVPAVAFLAVFIACIATALPAMISTNIRAGNHDKGNDDDRQKNDTDEIHFNFRNKVVQRVQVVTLLKSLK